MATRTRLELREGTSSKFWEGSVSGRSLVVRFGRIGTDGREKRKELADAKAAATTLAKLTAEKVKKGYAPVDGAAKASKVITPKTASASPKKVAAAPKKTAPGGKLAETLRALAADAVAAPKPATAAQLAKLDTAGADHADLRALYGFAGNLGAVLGNTDGLDWLDLRDAIDASRELHAHGSASGLLAIAGDGAGNYACFDPASGKVKDWDHETSEATPLAPSLASFLGERGLAVLRRSKKEQAAILAQKGKETAIRTLPATPKKIAKEPHALLAKLDSKGYSGGLESVTFLDEGRIVCGMQNSSRIVSLKEQKATDVDAPGRGVAYDPIGRRVILVSRGTVCFSSVDDGKMLTVFDNEDGDAVAVSPDGALACIVGSGHVSLWDLRGGKGIPKGAKDAFSTRLPKGKPIAALAGHDGNVTSVRFSPDGASLVTGDYDGRLCVWDVAKRARRAKVELGGSILGVDYATDGESIFVALQSSGSIEVLDRDAKPLRRWKCKEAYDVRALSPGAVATLSMVELAIVDPRNGKAFCKIPKGKGSRWPRIGGARGDLLLTTSPAGIFRVK